MNFDRWMYSTGLSKSSVLKYSGAIEGVLSDWAREGSLIQGSILDIKSKTNFDALVKKVHQLPIFQERNSTGHNMYSSALNKYSEYLSLGAIQSIEEDIEEIIYQESIEPTEKAQLISARVGQGQFRKSLLSYWGKCAVTGASDPALLLASHIKPWSKSNDIERLDRFNGLLLTPNLDRAFDQGLISFDPSGEILISSELKEPEKLGINESMKIYLETEHHNYMGFHRKNLFKST
ncbi:MAG: HNH endonuclease [Paraglaciecola chathamensis]